MSSKTPSWLSIITFSCLVLFKLSGIGSHFSMGDCCSKNQDLDRKALNDFQRGLLIWIILLTLCVCLVLFLIAKKFCSFGSDGSKFAKINLARIKQLPRTLLWKRRSWQRDSMSSNSILFGFEWSKSSATKRHIHFLLSFMLLLLSFRSKWSRRLAKKKLHTRWTSTIFSGCWLFFHLGRCFFIYAWFQYHIFEGVLSISRHTMLLICTIWTMTILSIRPTYSNCYYLRISSLFEIFSRAVLKKMFNSAIGDSVRG